MPVEEPAPSMGVLGGDVGQTHQVQMWPLLPVVSLVYTMRPLNLSESLSKSSMLRSRASSDTDVYENLLLLQPGKVSL